MPSIILKRLKNNCKVLSFEINKKFLKDLKRIKDRRLILIEDKAENLSKYLISYAVKNTDYIISSLPLASSRNLEYQIIKTAHENLKENGKYIQYQYAHNMLKSLGKLKKIFKYVEVKFVPLNIPPAFVYICKK